MTSEFQNSAFGSPDLLASELSPEIEKAVLQLVVDGFERWQMGGFQRFGDYEDHYTVRLVDCMNEIRREQNIGLVPRYQYVEPSDGMLEGLEDPARAPRIDMAVSWGLLTNDAYYSIECKRLAPDNLARLYVVCEMSKFVRGYYGAKAGTGGMVGYIIHGTPCAALQRVNVHVDSHPDMGIGHRLTPTDPVGHLGTVFSSIHSRPSPFQTIRLTHLFFDMTEIEPAG